MVELVMTMVVIGILAAVALPRFDTSIYRVLEFHDKTVAALRYAQKTATSHRRRVCVAFTDSTVTLTIALVNPSATCNASLVLPGGNSNVVQSNDPANAKFSLFPASIDFLPDGSGSGGSISIFNQSTMTITVVGTTGSVY